MGERFPQSSEMKYQGKHTVSHVGECADSADCWVKVPCLARMISVFALDLKDKKKEDGVSDRTFVAAEDLAKIISYGDLQHSAVAFEKTLTSFLRFWPPKGMSGTVSIPSHETTENITKTS